MSVLRPFFSRILNRRSLLAALILTLAGGGGYYAYSSSQQKRPEQRYRLHRLETGDIRQSVSANGTLNPVSLVTVGTQVSGTVRKLYVDFNDQVKQGQVLLELDDALLGAQARQSAANVQNVAAALDLAKANEARMRQLFSQGYVSKQEMDQATQAHRSAQAQLVQARAAADKDRANLNYSVIRSPVSGVIVARNVDIGQTVAASLQTPTLFQVAQDLSKMQIYTAFAEADIGNIQVGMPVRFTVDAFPNRFFKGEVKQIRLNPTTTSNVVTYNVVVTVDNPEQTLLPGMTAYTNIVVAQRKGVLTVPNAALRFKPSDSKEGKAAMAKGEGKRTGSAGPQPGGTGSGEGSGSHRKRDSNSGTVHVVRGEEIRPVSVTLGITDNRNTEIVAGELKAGDSVVLGEALPAPDTAAASGSTLRMRMF